MTCEGIFCTRLANRGGSTRKVGIEQGIGQFYLVICGDSRFGAVIFFTLAALMPHTSANERTIAIREADITLRADGIIQILYREGTVIDLDVQKRVLDVFIELTGDVKRPMLFEALDQCSVTREARENAIKMEDKVPASAYAVVAQSLAYKLIANFYLKVNKPKSPYRVFNNKEEALDWLRLFL
jgi:hypothetical protein